MKSKHAYVNILLTQIKHVIFFIFMQKRSAFLLQKLHYNNLAMIFMIFRVAIWNFSVESKSLQIFNWLKFCTKNFGNTPPIVSPSICIVRFPTCWSWWLIIRLMYMKYSTGGKIICKVKLKGHNIIHTHLVRSRRPFHECVMGPLSSCFM